MMMVFWAFFLGFVGYLPVGNINMTVVQLAVGNQRRRWQSFILFAAFMEFVYCFASLSFMDILLAEKQMIGLLNWTAVGVFLGLGLYTFFVLSAHAPSVVSSSGIKRGILLAIFNPLQIPFWMIWGVYILENGWVRRETTSIALFSFLCAVGTIGALWLYAIAGKKIVDKLRLNTSLLNRIIGALLILLALFQAIKILQP